MSPQPETAPEERRGGSRTRTWLLATVLVALVGVKFAWNSEREPFEEVDHVLRGIAWGADLTLFVHGRDARSNAGDELSRMIRETIESIDRAISRLDPSSEIARLNAHSAAGVFSVGRILGATLGKAATVAQRSGGAFDPALAPLLDAWGFGLQPVYRWPSLSELGHARSLTGEDAIVVDTATSTVRKRSTEIRCDLTAIAFGVAVDEIGQALEARGVREYLLVFGRAARARGRDARGRPWVVPVEKPDFLGPRVEFFVAFGGQSIAASSSTHRFTTVGPSPVSDVFGPGSLEPVRAAPFSVTVVHSDGTLANAWAAALRALGPTRGLALAERENLAAVFVTAPIGVGSAHKMTRAFAALRRGDRPDL